MNMSELQLAQKLAKISEKHILAIWTDKADFVDKVTDIDKLLEVRVFDANEEFRAYRSVVGNEFKCRELNDNISFADGAFDEAHYLDIDTTCNSQAGLKHTTGGGIFHLPDDVTLTMIKVRNYYKFDEDGVARKCDWRLVGFTDKEDT